MPDTQTIPLTDEEIAALASDPQAVAQFTSDERRRMVRLVPAKETISDKGYFEQLPGAQGMRWHPPEGGGSDVTRPDNSLFGMPPEMVVVPGVGIGRAMAGATGVAGTAVAGARAAASHAAPALKYEATKSALEAMGVPPSLAIPAAVAVSGYRSRSPRAPRASRTATTSSASTASPAAPAEPMPPPPAPAAAEGAPVSRPASSAGPPPSDPYRHLPPPEGGGIWSPQRVQSEVGLAFRRSAEYRAGVRLTEKQFEEAYRLVAQGKTPVEAAQTVASKVAASAPAAAPASTPQAQQPPARARLDPAEAEAYVRLRDAGKSHEDAIAAIVQQRQLAAKLGTPSPETVRQKVSDRNRTGRWQ